MVSVQIKRQIENNLHLSLFKHPHTKIITFYIKIRLRKYFDMNRQIPTLTIHYTMVAYSIDAKRKERKRNEAKKRTQAEGKRRIEKQER